MKTKKTNIKDIRIEQELYLPVKLHLASKSFIYQKEQMQFYEYRIDIYSYCIENNKTIAVELKISDFAKAIRQALIYQLCSDLVFIAMPITNAVKCNKDVIKRYGIGIIGVDEQGCCSILERAKTSTVIRRDYKKALIAELGRIN